MRVIGLTGGIASGKSTVARYLADLGAVIIDADQLARELVFPGRPALQEITSAFGSEVLQHDGCLDRKALGEIIFANPAKREQLDDIMIPKIVARTGELIDYYKHRGVTVVIDAPLLFEVGMTDIVDEIWVVYVPSTMQIQRLISRDGLTKKQAENRLASQLSIEKKREMADKVIDNTGDIAHTYTQVKEYWLNLHHKI